MLDIAESMCGPMTYEQIGFNFRAARYLAPELLNAFEAAGIDPSEIERPEIPLIVPGSKADDYDGVDRIG